MCEGQLGPLEASSNLTSIGMIYPAYPNTLLKAISKPNFETVLGSLT